jgi:hypothetical protein
MDSKVKPFADQTSILRQAEKGDIPNPNFNKLIFYKKITTTIRGVNMVETFLT